MLGTEIGLLVFAIVELGVIVFQNHLNTKLKKLNMTNVKLIAELTTKVVKLEGQIAASAKATKPKARQTKIKSQQSKTTK